MAELVLFHRARGRTPGARGAALVSAAFPASESVDGWPAPVPLQVHGMASDPEFANESDLPAARELVNAASDAKLFLYPGAAPLFVDDPLPSVACRRERPVRSLPRRCRPPRPPSPSTCAPAPRTAST